MTPLYSGTVHYCQGQQLQNLGLQLYDTSLFCSCKTSVTVLQLQSFGLRLYVTISHITSLLCRPLTASQKHTTLYEKCAQPFRIVSKEDFKQCLINQETKRLEVIRFHFAFRVAGGSVDAASSQTREKCGERLCVRDRRYETSSAPSAELSTQHCVGGRAQRVLNRSHPLPTHSVINSGTDSAQGLETSGDSSVHIVHAHPPTTSPAQDITRCMYSMHASHM
jgi:hypothetical protein